MKSTGYIKDGKYYSSPPPVDDLKDTHSTTEKLYERDRQRENHGRDLLQPYINGKPNPEFIQQYPDESKGYGFIKDE